jgi:hypothetical protein
VIALLIPGSKTPTTIPASRARGRSSSAAAVVSEVKESVIRIEVSFINDTE